MQQHWTLALLIIVFAGICSLTQAQNRSEAPLHPEGVVEAEVQESGFTDYLNTVMNSPVLYITKGVIACVGVFNGVRHMAAFTDADSLVALVQQDWTQLRDGLPIIHDGIVCYALVRPVVGEAVEGTWEFIEPYAIELTEDTQEMVMQVWSVSAAGVQHASSSAGQVVLQGWSKVTHTLEQTGNGVLDITLKAGEAIGDMGQHVGDVVIETGERTGEVMTEVGHYVEHTATEVWHETQQGVTTAAQSVGRFFKGLK